MAKLSETKSDMLSNTEHYCQAALPDKDSKRKIWDGLFETTYDNKSLLDHESLCDGIWQLKHLDLTAGFEEEFFKRIEQAVE